MHLLVLCPVLRRTIFGQPLLVYGVCYVRTNRFIVGIFSTVEDGCEISEN